METNITNLVRDVRTATATSSQRKARAPGTLEGRRLVDAPTFAHAVSIGISTFYEKVAAGLIPKPIKLGKSARWPIETVDQVVSEIAAGRWAA